MNVIGIYHHPQECGQPFVAFISQDTGKIIDSVDIPYGYYDSGLKMDTEYSKVGTWTRHIFGGGKEPMLENIEIERRWFKEDKKTHTLVPREVRNVKKDEHFSSFPTSWDADVVYDVCDETHVMRWVPEEDEFKIGMEQMGFDMTAWDVNTRRQTEFMQFLKEVFKTYNGYDVINVIEIG